ncbi:expressed unknown protein [Seminavis robusta]|uniref:Uncharacterized protein n=1 Tax=Seminavis robusta TaxID=568900 RepID=A0A9N8E386_9STRA|nr:expressed unknown protein [Seminavis robusta]|eukprot:Sro481_g151560.1 n/a (228) ;mRNA; r:29686-30369
MGLFSKLFPKKKKSNAATTGKDADNADTVTLASSTRSKESDSDSSSRSMTKSKKTKKSYSGSTPPPKPDNPKAVAAKTMAAKFIEYLNARDPDALKEGVQDSCMVVFAEQELPFDAYVDEAIKIFKAFPDFHIECPGGLQVEYDSKQRLCCVARDCVASGTHDGAPYAFGPFEEVEITNKFIKNDPETYYFYVNDKGKICDFQIEAKEGDMTGPAGFYQQIGGFPVL